MKALVLQELSKKQKSEVEALVKICLLEDGLERTLYLDKDMNFYENLKSFYLLYEEDKLLSVLAIYEPLETEAEISAYTLPAERRKGYFYTLLELALDELAGYDIERVLFVIEPKSKSGLFTLDTIDTKYVKSEYLLTVNLKEYQRNRWEDASTDNSPKHRTKSQLRIQSLKNETKKEAVYLGRQIFSEEYMDISEFQEDNPNDSLGAYLEEDLIGVCNVTYSPEYASIFGFGIHSDYRGQGYGRVFLEEVITYAKEKGLTTLNLAVGSENPTAYSLYKSMGFLIQTQYDYYEYLIEWE